MRKRLIQLFLSVSCLALSAPSVAAGGESLPHLVQSAEAVEASGFLELRGPGKIEIDGRVNEYSETVFVPVARISSLTGVFGQPRACVMHFDGIAGAVEIALLAQNCAALLEQIREARGER